MAIDPFTLAIIGQGLVGLFGANQASSASKDASALQAQAAREAAQLQAQAQRESLDFQRQVYNQGRTDQQPWIGAGQGAVGKLAHLMGIGGGSGGGGFAPLQSRPAGARGSGGINDGPSGGLFGGTNAEAPFWLAAPRARQYGQPAAAYRWPGQQAAAEDAKPPTPNNTRQRPYTRPARVPGTYTSNSGVITVTMRAPDGTTQRVPADQVEHYTSLGAQIVPGGDN